MGQYDEYFRNNPDFELVNGVAQLKPGVAKTSLNDLVTMVNEVDQAAQQKANAGRIPGGAGLEEQSSGNISQALAGQLDPSVLQQLGQQSAERGVMTGSPSGPGTNADYLRSLGLTSLDLMNTGQNWLTQATGRNPSAPIYSAGNQVLTAAQQQQLAAEQNRMAQQQQVANQALRAQQSAAWNASKPQWASASAGGGGLHTGGGYTNGMYTGGGGGGGSPAVNWAGMFGGNSGAPFVGSGGNVRTGTGGVDDVLWANSSPTDNWMDDLLWNNASDVNTGTTGAFDYNNWDDVVGGMA